MRLQALIRWRLWTACALGMLLSTPSLAQYTSDIDIYSGEAASGAANVLIIMDNTPNWNLPFSAERSALRETINKLPLNKFRVGLMMYTEAGGDNKGNQGAYVRSAIRLLDAAYKPKFLDLLDSINVGDDRGKDGSVALSMVEAYAYFTGGAPYGGNQKVKTDYTGNTNGGTLASNAIYQQPGNALNSRNGTAYNSPLIPGNCDRNYILYISNGPAMDPTPNIKVANDLLKAAYQAAGLTQPPALDIVPPLPQNNPADDWARFMKDTPSAITTFTLDVDPKRTGQGPAMTTLLKSAAVHSGGEYYAVNSTGTEIAAAMGDIFNKMQAIDSVFASASLPISTSSRGTFLNQVFMGVFRPDGDSKPRWRGNLKQYEFKYNVATDTLELADVNGDSAVVSSTGFLSPTATSFWTQPSDFWKNQKMGSPLSESDSPDGYVVEKGGAAQMIRQANLTDQTSRNVLTCVGTGSTIGCIKDEPLKGFPTSNSSNIFQNISSNQAERDNIISWARGTDNAGDEAGPGGTTTVRPSVHGDVLHSRPAVVNYGNGNIVVFYGTNDGSLRAINGKKTGTGAGQELWSFIPEEHFSKLKRLRDNSPAIRISTTPPSITTATLRDYFVDGPVSVYQKLNSDQTTEKAILYVGMRRGGRFIYAIDVTDPANPKFLWRRSNNDEGFSRLGQTWSEPRVTRLKDYPDPVLVMGGGYDAVAEDAATRGTTNMGNSVMVINALTGEMLEQYETDRSVAADVTLVSMDNQGYTDRAYAVDVGGNIYRIDFQKTTGASTSTARKDWDMYKLAALQASGDPRKFFYAPAVVPTQNFVAVQVGSGDREKPLKTTGNDAFFTVFDDRITKGTPEPKPAPITMGAGMGQVGTSEDMTNGCYIPFAVGEKAVNAPTAFMGSTYFGTNKPSSGLTCKANLGDAKLYEAPMFCRSPVTTEYVGGGLPPSPVAGVVEVSYVITNPDGTTSTVTKRKPILIGGPNSKKSAIETTDKTKTVNLPRKRRYWYQEQTR